MHTRFAIFVPIIYEMNALHIRTNCIQVGFTRLDMTCCESLAMPLLLPQACLLLLGLPHYNESHAMSKNVLVKSQKSSML